MIEASISTVPSRVRTEPWPALKRGSSSSTRTAPSTASSAEPPAAEHAPAGQRRVAHALAELGRLRRIGAGAAVDDDRRNAARRDAVGG